MVQFDCFALSEQGANPNRNDDFTLLEPAIGVFVIADGMGGRPGGAEASSRAVNSFYETILALEPLSRVSREHLAQAIDHANAEVHAIGEADPMKSGLGTTLSAVVLRENRGKVVHVGDSRVYLFRDGRLRQLTEDHTLVAALIERQLMTVEGAKHYPLRNVLARCIGPWEEVEADIQDLTVQTGDWLILATDGLTEVMEADRIERIVAAEKAGPADLVCHAIMAVAEQNHPRDNITIAAVRIVDAVALDKGAEPREEA